ncbi:histidine kinase N-terminal 7TM domain-containing protein [Methanospirillum stamsii]|uniref:histidine kinase n=1 Tax=Methanospirillum stamsii TaxID=1277351 RepID=A0A2V2N736_9EURY|nr:histidine kinase N-terminal 7TM domain-containing protein [Methanospirillum stamsii]PWR75872.1 hypothetical protein DLD82_02060 [Methanospirillum stamsii]
MQVSLYILILLITICISLSLAIYGFRRYSEPEMAAFGYLMTFIAVWAIGTAGEFFFSGIGMKLFWTIIIYTGNQTSPVLFLIFILLLTRSGTWFPQKCIPVLFFIPAITIFLAGTNELHHLLWTSARIVETTIAGQSLVIEHGPWFPVEVVYIYLILAVSLICIIRVILSGPGIFNRQMVIILIASLIPIIGNILYTNFGPALSGIDTTPVLFSFTGIFCGYAISRHNLLEIFPAAYEQIFRNLQEGVIVLDHKNRIISLNPAACKFTKLSESVIGEDAISALHSWPDIGLLLTGSQQDIEIEADFQWFHIRSNSMPSGHSGKDGRLIIIQDITIRKNLMRDLEKSSADIQRTNVKLSLMSGVIRHDIVNELTIILSAFNLIDPPHDPIEKDLWSGSKEAAQNILKLVRFTREYEEMGLKKPEWIDLWEAVDNEGVMVTGDIRFENLIPRKTMIYSDSLIRTVIRNLIDNAIRHGGIMHVIRFSMEKSESGEILICEDDGKGIKDTEKQSIFRRGYGENTGMGLYFIREILSVGEMGITETGKKGCGARFEITIPEDLIRRIPDHQ